MNKKKMWINYADNDELFMNNNNNNDGNLIRRRIREPTLNDDEKRRALPKIHNNKFDVSNIYSSVVDDACIKNESNKINKTTTSRQAESRRSSFKKKSFDSVHTPSQSQFLDESFTCSEFVYSSEPFSTRSSTRIDLNSDSTVALSHLYRTQLSTRNSIYSFRTINNQRISKYDESLCDLYFRVKHYDLENNNDDKDDNKKLNDSKFLPDIHKKTYYSRELNSYLPSEQMPKTYFCNHLGEKFCARCTELTERSFAKFHIAKYN